MNNSICARLARASLLLAALAFALSGLAPAVFAAALTSKSDTLSRLDKSNPTDVLSDHAIQFTTPTGVASTQAIVITFPSDFDGSNDPQGALDFNDVDLLEDTGPDGVCDGTGETLVASAPSSSQWSAAFSGTENRVLTFTSGGASAIITAGSEVCVKIGENATGGTANSQYINPTTSGSKTITLSVGSGADTGDIVISILDDDQVSVTADVDESIAFSLGATSVSLGTLSTTAVTSGSHTISVATNAAGGATITYAGTTLTSGGNTITALSGGGASSVGTEQFGLNVKDNATPNVGAECSGSAPIAAAASGYGTADSFKFVSGETVVSSSGPVNTTSCTVSYIANIAGTTEAGSYSTALTYVATANF